MAKDVVVKNTTASFQDWIPVRVYDSGSGLEADWCYAGTTRFTHPFFSDTLREILRRPFCSLFPRRTTIGSLREIASDSHAIPPTGFVFHMSRCGSTLVAQMLASVEKNLVVSEAPPIDDVLALSRARDDEARASYLSSIVRALGRRRDAREKHYFVKFDSWHTLDLDLIVNTFPNVPYIFLYREPIEVIVSQMRQQGSQMIPGAIGEHVLGLSLDEGLKISREEYSARIVARICEGALEHANDPRCLLVNYDQLPDAFFGSVVRHFGVEFDEGEIETMRNASQYDAKMPQLYFESDREKKRNEATDGVREAASIVKPLYDKLENIRRER